MVSRDHTTSFLEGKNLSFVTPDSALRQRLLVLEKLYRELKNSNCKAIKSSWKQILYQWCMVSTSGSKIYLKGEVLKQCRELRNDLLATSINFVRYQSNRVAREVARLPYLDNCQNIFTSLLPPCLPLV